MIARCPSTWAIGWRSTSSSRCTATSSTSAAGTSSTGCSCRDAVYDATDFDMPVTRSLAELVAEWTSEEGMTRHPLAHHSTNVVVLEDDDGTVRVLSKGIGVGAGGRVGSVTYRDVAVRVDGGWRLASRTAVLRRAPEHTDQIAGGP